MKVAILFLMLAAGAVITAQAAARSEWRPGKLADLSAAMTTQPNGKPAPRKVYTYSVDAGDRIYQAQETDKKAPHVEVNAPITYSVSKDYLYVRDLDNKVHKLALVKTTLK